MNGNFEVDRGAYPFSGVSVGDSLKLHHVPTMQRLLNVPLPRDLAARASLRLNVLYYAAKAGGEKFVSDLATVKRVVGEELTGLVQSKDISGPAATQLQLQIDGAEA